MAFLSLFSVSVLMILPQWILSYQRIWDAEWEMKMTIASLNRVLHPCPLFLCTLSQKNWASIKNQQISAFSPVHLGIKTPLYLSYTMPLAENESLHCNFMLPRCRAPFWRAHDMFVGTSIMIASPLRTANLYAVSTRVKVTDREALHLKDFPIFWWVSSWSFSFCATSLPCSGLTKWYYLWNATAHTFLQLCETHCHQINRSMRQWTKKCLPPGTIIVTGGANAPGPDHAIIPLLQETAGLHGSGCQGGQQAIGLPSTSSACTRPVTCPKRSQCSSVTRLTRSLWSSPPSLAYVALAGLIWKQHRGGRGSARHWRPHSKDRSLLRRPSKRAPRGAAAARQPITRGTGCFSCLLSFFTDTSLPYGGPKA